MCVYPEKIATRFVVLTPPLSVGGSGHLGGGSRTNGEGGVVVSHAISSRLHVHKHIWYFNREVAAVRDRA